MKLKNKVKPNSIQICEKCDKEYKEQYPKRYVRWCEFCSKIPGESLAPIGLLNGWSK